MRPLRGQQAPNERVCGRIATLAYSNSAALSFRATIATRFVYCD
jgi:hypothetical protein